VPGYFDNYILKVIQKLFAKNRVIEVNNVTRLHNFATSVLTRRCRKRLRLKDSES